MASVEVSNIGTALALDKFWPWLAAHSDCILSLNTLDAWLHDHDDFHWHLRDEHGQRLVQLMRGKVVVAEVVIDLGELLYVEIVPSAEEQGHFEFHVLAGSDQDMQVVYNFLLAHGYEEEQNHLDSH